MSATPATPRSTAFVKSWSSRRHLLHDAMVQRTQALRGANSAVIASLFQKISYPYQKILRFELIEF